MTFWKLIPWRLSRRLGSFGAAGALVFGACGPTATQCAPTPTGSSSAITLDAKPVEGPCTYTDTFGAPRGGDRVHLGTDILAAEGNEVYAVSAGEVVKVYTDDAGSLAGNGLRFRRADGTVIFYAHMLRVSPGIGVGTELTAGQVVGYVGETGNAGVPHLHVEIHPGGGEAVNPYPIIRAIGAC